MYTNTNDLVVKFLNVIFSLQWNKKNVKCRNVFTDLSNLLITKIP